MKYLTELQIKKYEDNGFLLLKKFFSEEEMEPTIKSINKFSELPYNFWEAGKEMAYYETSRENENERILCRIEKYVDYHPEFQKLANSKKVLSAMEDLMGGPCILFKDKINFKRPGAGGYRPHQDVQARWDDFASYFMNALITIDDNGIDNGCLYVAPGHHKRKLIGKYDEQLQGSDLEGMNFVPVIASRGDTIFFDCFLPHKSDANLGERSRRNIYLTYNRMSEGNKRNEYITRKRKELPPDNERKDDSKIKDCYAHNYLS